MVVPPFHTPKWSFLVGNPMVVGYHHFRNPPCIILLESLQPPGWTPLAGWRSLCCHGDCSGRGAWHAKVKGGWRSYFKTWKTLTWSRFLLITIVKRNHLPQWYIYIVDGKHGTYLKRNASMIVELVKFHRGIPAKRLQFNVGHGTNLMTILITKLQSSN